MKKKVISVFVFIFFAAVSFSQASINDDIRYPSEKLIEAKERWRVADDWLSQGDKVVKLTNNQEAKMVMTFLRDSFYMMVPVFSKSGLSSMVAEEPGKGEYHLGFVSLLPKDRNISESWKNVYEGRGVAAFHVPDEKIPSIVIKDNIKINDLWKGLIIIHEGVHALSFGIGTFDEISDPFLRRSLSELYAYDLEIRLIEEIGGSRYQDLLKREIKRLRADYIRKKVVALPDYDFYRVPLEEIFGKCQSEEENAIRVSLFWINSIFRMIDKIYPNEEVRDKKKVDFLWSSYKNGNME